MPGAEVKSQFCIIFVPLHYRYNESIMKKILYHGSNKVIEIPVFGFGNPHNDYGLGFYCTENIELAKEWASSEAEDGFVNRYELDLDALSVYDLSEGNHILNWLAILLENRTFDLSSVTAAAARDYILETFRPSYEGHDVIIGYRADDSYFSFAKDFLNNTIPLEKLSEAMRLGKLGEQVVLKSERAFEMLVFTGAEAVDNKVYYPKRRERDSAARLDYRLSKTEFDILNARFVIDIVREKWNNNDERLR